MGNTISGGARLPDKGDTQLHTGCPHTTSNDTVSQQASAPTSKLNSSLSTHNDGQSTRKATSRKKNTNNTDGQLPKGLLVMTLGVFLSGALAGKALSSSQRARRAEHSAKAWERVCMALASKNHPTQAKPSYPSPKRIRDGQQQQQTSSQHIKDDRTSWEELTGEPKIELPTSRSSTWNSTYQISKRLAPIIKSPSTDTTSLNRSPYAAIHPHEDWDWTPADHPRSLRRSWQKTRLPPWSIGFTSAPKIVQEEPSSLKGSTASALADDSIEDHLIRAAIWPACDVGNASEAEFIAEEVYRDMSHKHPSKSEAKMKEVKSEAESESDAKGKASTAQEEKLTEDVKKRITATILVKEIRQRRAREQEEALRLERERKTMMQEKARLVRSRSEAFWKRRVVADSEEAAKRVRQERLEQEDKKASSRDSISKEESELHQTLQRHMWALMARAQNLEDKIRRYESRNFF